ncbi:LysR family transcriptional regulator [Vibrio barjaei]|uniref:LysR family transcriptional regulator n=1 Tax=Vibrio barjaei TaxID=1676683 RepID=UPI0007BBA3B0|nr:LysR family transcriptional regulator [Vibrio barjaei]
MPSIKLSNPVAKDRFANLDLNLLRVFKVLYEEKNMRKAAERLYVSQPAVSQSLQKLRHQFDDPLFVKVKSGLAPTPFSEQLSSSLLPLLYDIENVINDSDVFDPAQLDQDITIALSSSFVFSISGELYRYFREHAPGLRIHIASWNDQTVTAIEKGEILLGINAELTDSYPFMEKRTIGDINACLLVRKDHPITKKKVTVESMSKYPLARLIVSNYSKYTSPTVEIFKGLGHPLEVGFSSEYPVALIDVVQQSDMFMGTSNCFPIHNYPNLVMLSPDQVLPEAQYPALSYFHSRHQNSALVNWLNESITHIFQQRKTENANYHLSSVSNPLETA